MCRVLIGFTVVFLAFTAGCGEGEGVGLLKEMQAAKAEATQVIEDYGGKVSTKKYPPGEGTLVDLTKATIDDELIAAFEMLERVTELDLTGTSISDEQLATLAAMQSTQPLLSLKVGQTAITDEGIGAFKDHNLLYQLDVSGAKTSKAGMESFKRNRPKHPFGMKLKVKQ